MHHQLQEIDATTGKSIETFGTNGVVDLRQGLGRDPKTMIRIQSQNPGKVFENLILMGSTTGENFMSPPGDIRAFDVVTGKLVWQFHTLPHPGEPGYETWPKDAWKYVGGVNDWAELSVDEKRGVVYIPLGSGTYDFYGADRIGDDLYANCILALDARTGKYKWHFQEVHHDLWDFDAVSAPQLVTIMHNGKKVDVVAHAGKTGFLYVLDRDTGKPIWPIEERPVPASDMPGEVASKTQPFPTVVPAFGRQKFTSADINPYLPEDRKAELIKRIDESRNEGIFTPPGFKETVSMPGNQGGSNWGTTASNPAKGQVYVLSVDAPALLKMSAAQPSMSILGNAGRPVAGPGATPVNDPGRAVYEKNCMACHGPERTGGGSIPSLVDVTTRISPDVIEGIVQNGNGQMPAFPNLDSAQLRDLIAYLGIGATGPAVAATPASTKPAGPVVANGGVPAGEVLAKSYMTGRSPYGIMDGPAYPSDTKAPTERYFSGWNVMTSIIAPPWNKLTAYDLNKGTIMWQKSVGTDPGIVTTEHGLAATSTGLIFLPTQDGKVRAYDAETGDVLWTADLPAGIAYSAVYLHGERQGVSGGGCDREPGDRKRQPGLKTAFSGKTEPGICSVCIARREKVTAPRHSCGTLAADCGGEFVIDKFRRRNILGSNTYRLEDQWPVAAIDLCTAEQLANLRGHMSLCKNNVTSLFQGGLPRLDHHRTAHSLVVQFSAIGRGGADRTHGGVRA